MSFIDPDQVDTDGPVQLGSVVAGESADADRPTVVFLGALGATKEIWDAQVERLAADTRVVALDLRGHGDSEAPAGPYTIEALAKDVGATLDELGIQRCHLVGLSIGGAVAQWIAVHSPERLETLTLMCTAPALGDPTSWAERAAMARDEGPAELADTVVSRWVTKDGTTQRPELVERLREMVAGTDPEGYAGCCEALAEFDLTGELDDIGMPTLVISAPEDGSTPPEVVAPLAEGIPGARLAELERGAHLVAAEFPDDVAPLLREHFGLGG